MRRIVRFVAIYSVAVAVAMVLVAQGSAAGVPQRKGTGILTGIVLGPDDKPVPHASVTYQSSGGSAPHAVHADAHGRFTITKLKSDNYDLRAYGKGVFSEWQKNISVRSGQTKTVNLQLIYAKEIPKAYAKKKKQQQQ